MTRTILAVLAVMGALVLLGRSVQGRTATAPAPTPDEWDSFVPMAAWTGPHRFVVGEVGPELLVLPGSGYRTSSEWRN